MKTFIFAFIASAAAAVIGGFAAVPFLKKLKVGQNILGYVKEHDYKSGTPTMGGIIFVVAAIIVFSVFSSGKKSLAFVSVAIGAAYLLVGFADDFIKVRLRRNEGLNPLQKTIFELVIATVISIYSYKRGVTNAFIPFTRGSVDFKGFFIPFCVLVFLATTNSVNLTDGLDGLAGGVSYVYLLALAALIVLQTILFSGSYANTDEYKNLSLLCVSLAGGIIGFLLFNTFKASVFMGDTGSLYLGGMVVGMAFMLGSPLIIIVAGFVYICEIASDILQVGYFKLTHGKRLFKMAPIHHHFEKCGWSEVKIVAVFASVAVLFCVLAWFGIR